MFIACPRIWTIPADVQNGRKTFAPSEVVLECCIARTIFVSRKLSSSRRNRFVASDAKLTDLFLQILSGVVGILHGADAYLSFVHYKTGR